MKSKVLMVAAAAAAGVLAFPAAATAGEVTGNGKQTGMRDHARSACGFSGREDEAGSPLTTQTPHRVWVEVAPGVHVVAFPPPGTPGRACNPAKGGGGVAGPRCRGRRSRPGTVSSRAVGRLRVEYTPVRPRDKVAMFLLHHTMNPCDCPHVAKGIGPVRGGVNRQRPPHPTAVKDRYVVPTERAGSSRGDPTVHQDELEPISDAMLDEVLRHQLARLVLVG